MIELRPLRQFLVLAEELHFGRAAERLHMTQPPLSLAVQKLEAQLGVQLLERGRRTVALTAAGLALVEAALRLVEQADQVPARVRAAASGEAGRLSLGFVSTVGYGDMPRWLRLFREALPDVQLALREATLDVQLRGFETGELDAGFAIHAPGAEPAGFECLTVSTEPLVLAHAEDWALARRRSPSLEDVLREPLVVFPREIGFMQQVQSVACRLGRVGPAVDPPQPLVHFEVGRILLQRLGRLERELGGRRGVRI